MSGPMVHLLMHIGRLMERAVEVELAPLQLHHAQARVLTVIERCRAITQANLARGLDVKPASVTAVLKPLERRGLIRRETDPRTNRAVVVRLTTAGQALCEEIHAAWSRVEASLGAALSEDDRAAGPRLLHAIRNALGGGKPEFAPYRPTGTAVHESTPTAQTGRTSQP